MVVLGGIVTEALFNEAFHVGMWKGKEPPEQSHTMNSTNWNLT